ncbi:type II toxin-antitoxin system RelE/ParE family toxin [Paracoccus benzoatiresistens]|uniref:Type II toxin-antitoxin system RelE/ParE family toxin n=1 Tax=Paracoccus benzoatiresistens TaxID=2997341 RepID=A0ABT4JBY6_9RHOB|nr:type II toxin-antitoxin system RelE/ParE family toxin [Paracoccus sp. EF6]MCZ0964419.1 type II toxin-antitoxin system RelE/ParE family toxin [Paracoccus sp. EF6]
MIVEITATAEADLEAIGDYIARDNPARAVTFMRELYHCCVELAEVPFAWPVVPRYKQHGIRRRVHGRYLIFYRVDQERITILHVLNGAMDVEAILFPEA